MHFKHYLTLLAVTFVMIPISAVRPMTSLFVTELGASEGHVGLLAVCYSLAPLLIAIFAGRYIDHFGEKIPVVAGAMGIGVALTLVYFFPNLIIIYLSQLILGGSHLLTFVSIQNRVASAVPTEKRSQAVASFALFASLGSMTGPVIGGYMTEIIGFITSYLLLACFALVPLLISLFLIPSKGKKEVTSEEESQRLLELLKIPGLSRAIGVSMLILAALDLFYVYFPIYGSSIGLSPSQIGWVIMLQSLATMISRIFLPKLVERFGKVSILFSFMLSGAIFYALIPLFSVMALLAILAVLIGFGLGIVQPLTVLISYNLAPKGRTGEVLATRMAGNRLAQVVIPLAFAGLVHLTGVGVIFVVKGILLAVGSYLAKSLPE